MNRSRRAVIIAGASGSGKTTFAREFLPFDAACPVFVNRELIAAGLAPFGVEATPARAERVMREELQRHFIAGASFAFETTLVDTNFLRAIARWQAAGYRVKMIYLSLDNAELACARIAQRTFPEKPVSRIETIRSELAGSFQQFTKFYAPRVDSWALYDNSGVQPILLDWHEPGRTVNSIERARDRDLRASLSSIRRTARHVHELATFTGMPIAVARNGVVEWLVPGPAETVTIHEISAAYG